MRIGGVVLCGGKSRRMGVAKANLPFGSETMLARVIRLLRESVWPIVVVAAGDQLLPELPPDVMIARDGLEAAGPLEGLRAGMEAMAIRADAVYATSCDVPLLVPAFVTELIRQLDNFDAVVPVDDDFHHPLASIYRCETVLPRIVQLLGSGERRPRALFDSVHTLRIPVEQLRNTDPDLLTLMNLNHPQDYAAALERAGLTLSDGLRDS